MIILDLEKERAWKHGNPAPLSPATFLHIVFSRTLIQRSPRHQAARVSELLQSQLLQPLNVTPIQPELAEADLAILQGAGPSELSFNEFNPLFTRDGLALQANGIVGSNDTFGDDLVLSSIKGLFSGSIGQFHYETNGVRENNELDHDIYNAFGQLQLTPDLNIQAELRRRRTQNGDLGDMFSIFEPAGFNPDLEQKLEQDSQRFGFHFRPARKHDIIASYHHITSDFALSEPDDSFFTTDEVDSQNVDVRYQVRAKHVTPIAGFSYLDGSRGQLTTQTAPEIDPETDEPIRDENGNLVVETTRSAGDFHERFVSGYFYLPFHVGRAATLTLGMSADHIMGLLGRRDTDKTRLNPKLGLIWSFTDDTTLRLAFFRTLKRQFWARQTLEPTHIGGFNQIFDDLNGTESTRYGVGLDHRFSDRLLAGVEGSWRDLSIPLDERVDGDESIYSPYFNWLPNQSTALTAQYNYEKLRPSEGYFPCMHWKLTKFRFPRGTFIQMDFLFGFRERTSIRP